MPLPAVTSFPAPSLALLAAEPFRAVLDFFSAHLGQPPLVQGDRHPVIVYPGLGAGPLHMSQLRQYLRACKLTVYDWEFGVNTGPEGHVEEWLERMAERLLQVWKQHDRRVSLVGWSLGGIYARELAKHCPQAVRQVVTLATPFHSIEGGNHAATMLSIVAGTQSSRLTPELLARLREPPPVPSTSIYSRSDGMVSWRGCLQAAGPQVENVSVHASHLGMPTHPDVLRVVADRLAQPEGRWRPYRRRRVRLKAPS